MKNLLFVAMMIVGSLLFVATGASAQYCSTFLPSCHWQEAAGIKLQQENQEALTASGEQFVPAVPAMQEGEEAMVAAGAAGMTGLKDAHENAAQFATGRELCGYCSMFERAGFP
jgi:hypothetical protein